MAAPISSRLLARSWFMRNARISTKTGSVALKTEAKETVICLMAIIESKKPPYVITTTLSKNNSSVFVCFRGVYHETNRRDVKPMNMMETVLKNMRQNVAVGTPTSAIDTFTMMDDKEKQSIEAKPPMIPRTLLG